MSAWQASRVSQARLERLVNLTLALMATQRPLPVAEIAARVYREAVEDESFRRRFERDKEALREQGIPVVTEIISVWDDSEVGYRIPRADYALPDITLSAEEAAALGLAAQFWNGATLGRGSASALRKLAATGVAPADPGIAVSVRVDEGDPSLAPLLAAVRNRQAVRFDYRGTRDDAAHARTLEPWGVVSWHGRWYVVGRDRDRSAERAFRLSRVAGGVKSLGRPAAYDIPTEVDLLARVAEAYPERPRGQAHVRVDPDTCWALRRQAIAIEDDVLTLDYGYVDRLAEQLAGLVPQAVALDPPELVVAIVDRLQAALQAHT